MKQLLPVIHIQNVEQTIRNVELVRNAGLNGFFLIHHRASADVFFNIAIDIRRRFADMWIGLNCLSASPTDMFAGAPRGFQAFWTDTCGITSDSLQNIEWHEAMNEIEPARFHRYEHVRYYGGFAFKYQKPVVNLVGAAKVAARFVDVITTSGDGTGVAADLQKIQTIYEAVEGKKPLGIASGITPDNAEAYLPFVEKFLVATGISIDDHNLDPYKLMKLREKIESYR